MSDNERDNVPVLPWCGGVTENGMVFCGGSMINRINIPQSTYACRPTAFKDLEKVERECTSGLQESCRLDPAGSGINFIDWLYLFKNYCEKRGLDGCLGVVNDIYNPTEETKTYWLDKFGAATIPKAREWCTAVVAGANGEPCEQYIRNLRWLAEALSITFDLAKTVKDTISHGAPGPVVFAAIGQATVCISHSVVRKMVEDLKQLSLDQEPGQDITTFSIKVKTLADPIQGSTISVPDLATTVTACYLRCSTEAFRIDALKICSEVDTVGAPLAVDAAQWGTGITSSF